MLLAPLNADPDQANVIHQRVTAQVIALHGRKHHPHKKQRHKQARDLSPYDHAHSLHPDDGR